MQKRTRAGLMGGTAVMALAGHSPAVMGQAPLKAHGAAGTEIRTAVIGAPCTGDPRPQVRPSVLPQNGILRLSPAERRSASCPEMRAPVVVVFYKSKPDFRGTDSFAIDVTQGAHKQSQAITVEVQ